MTEPQNSTPETDESQAAAAAGETVRTPLQSEDPMPTNPHTHTPTDPQAASPPPPHMALGSWPVARMVGIVVTLAVLLVFWLLWRGRELPFTEMRYQLTDSTGYQPLARQQYLMGSVPRSVNGHRAGPAHSSLSDLPDGTIPTAALKLTNPYPEDGIAAAPIRQLYVTNCSMCHGVTGHGDGPVGESYIPRPPDLTGPEIAALPEGQIYYSITNGILSEPIPEAARYIPRDWHAFRQELSDRDRWTLVSFVRSLSGRALAQAVETNHAAP